MGALVLNWAFVILLSICTKLNICTSNSPTSPSPKTLVASIPEPRKFEEIMNITEIKILFETFENEESFIKTEEDRIETLKVTYFTNSDNETIYLVRFKDIGLDSKFGEIRIV